MDQKKTILFVNGHLDVGGVEKSLYDLLSHIDYSKFDIDLLLFERRGVYAHSLPDNVHLIFKDTNRVWGAWWKVIIDNLKNGHFSNIWFRVVYELSNRLSKRFLRLIYPILGIKKEYDYAVAYRVGFPNYIVSYAVNSKNKICWWHHGECIYDLNSIKSIKDSWRRINTIVTVSEGTRDLVKKVFDIDENRISVIPNMIDISNLEQKASTGIPIEYENRCFKIVTIGRICKEKHIEEIPQIAVKLIERGFDSFIWYIVGDGDEMERIKQAILSVGLMHRIVMLGERQNPYPYIKYADLLVHTSRVEAHCITLLEAMALKTPCIATETVIPQDFTKDRENCFLVEQNAQSKVICILNLVLDHLNIEPIIERAFQLVHDSYSPRIIISKVERLFS